MLDSIFNPTTTTTTTSAPTTNIIDAIGGVIGKDEYFKRTGNPLIFFRLALHKILPLLPMIDTHFVGKFLIINPVFKSLTTASKSPLPPELEV